MLDLKHKILVKVICLMALSGCISSTSNEDKGPTLKILWDYAYIPVSAPHIAPTIDEDRILISNDLFLTALNFVNGQVAWKEPLPSHRNVRSANLSFTDNQIFGVILRVDQPSNIDAISWDRTTGKQLWRTTFGDTLKFQQNRFLGATDNFVLASTNGSRLVILNHDGTVHKFMTFDKSPTNVSINGDIAYIAHLSSANNLASGKVTAVDMTSWTTKWEYETNHGMVSRVKPIIDSGMVYAGTTEGYASEQRTSAFFALDSETGDLVWKRSGLQAYDVVLHGDHLYINDAGGIHKLRKDNGKTVWHTNFGSSGTAPIAYGYGHVYAPHSGAMRILNALSGEIVHIMSPPYGSYFWKVTAAEGRIFAQSNSHLYAFAPWGHEDALELNDWQDAGR